MKESVQISEEMLGEMKISMKITNESVITN